MSSDFHNRKTLRLRDWDYSRPDAYFVTICTAERQCLFGDVMDGKMALNDVGRMVENIWVNLPEYFPNIEMDTFVVMPNHFHGVMHILRSANQCRRDGLPRPSIFADGHGGPSLHQPTPSIPTKKMTLSDYMHRFKSFTTHSYRKKFPDRVLWQNGYYEHIIRNEDDYWRICEYVANNPGAWDDDDENPRRKKQ